MKKVSFIKGRYYLDTQVEFLSDNDIDIYFDRHAQGPDYHYVCLESFTAEITVKIVPYEQQ